MAFSPYGLQGLPFSRRLLLSILTERMCWQQRNSSSSTRRCHDHFSRFFHKTATTAWCDLKGSSCSDARAGTVTYRSETWLPTELVFSHRPHSSHEMKSIWMLYIEYTSLPEEWKRMTIIPHSYSLHLTLHTYVHLRSHYIVVLTANPRRSARSSRIQPSRERENRTTARLPPPTSNVNLSELRLDYRQFQICKVIFKAKKSSKQSRVRQVTRSLAASLLDLFVNGPFTGLSVDLWRCRLPPWSSSSHNIVSVKTGTTITPSCYTIWTTHTESTYYARK